MTAVDRTLRLRRESLTDLNGDDLAAVAGGEYRYTNDALTCTCRDWVDLTPLTCACNTFPNC